MSTFLGQSAFFGVGICLITYQIGVQIRKKTGWAVRNPLLISIALVILLLIGLRIDYSQFKESSKYISFLLTPATVCLAVPLYEKLQLLKDNFAAIIAGIIAGVLTSLTCVLIFCLIFKLSHENYVTLLPKSITTAIGMDVSKSLGGSDTITASVIIITGVLGNVIADVILKLFRITDPIAKGIALGTSAHAIGTSKALEIGETEGAMSSLSIAVAGLLTVLGSTIYANFF